MLVKTSKLNIMCDELPIAVNNILSAAEEKGYHITEMATTGESTDGTFALLLPPWYGDKIPVTASRRPLYQQDTIPLLLAYGTRDVMVSPNVKEPMLEALGQSNASYDYILFPNSGHSLYNDPEQMEEHRTKVNEYVEKHFAK